MRSACFFVCLCSGLLGQQASIEGTAINAVTREPLSDVHIRLMALGFNGINSTYGAMSDRAGHFSIALIRPGAYIPVPEHTGFLFVPAKSPESRVSILTIKPGEHRTDWVVEMAPRAVLTGHVLDENGDPVQGVTVRTVDVKPADGQLMLVSAPNFGTDDRGEFRIVVPPGKFYLQADLPGRTNNERPEIRSDGSTEPAYGTTYYPSSAIKERGAVVEAIAGKDVGGLDIRLQRQAAGMNIKGTVSGMPPGMEGNRAMVVIQYGDSAQRISNGRSISAGADGRFSFPAPQSGYYRLTAVYGSGKTQMVSRVAELQLEGADPPGVDLALIPGIEVAGTLVIEGDPPGTAAEKRSVRLEQTGPGGGFTARHGGGEVDRDGAFRIEGVAPGKFRVRVDSIPENAYVKAVDVDGAVSADGTVDFSTARPSRVKVTVSRNGARITGTVLDEEGARLETPLAMVLLVPFGTELKGMPNLAEDSTQRVSGESKYTFNGVRPGKYRLLAVDTLRMAGDDMVERLGKMAGRAETIEVKEGDRLAKDVRLLPKEDADAKPKP